MTYLKLNVKSSIFNIVIAVREQDKKTDSYKEVSETLYNYDKY